METAAELSIEANGAWRTMAQLPAARFDSFCVDGDRILATSHRTGASARFAMSDGALIDSRRDTAAMAQVLPDARHDRYLALATDMSARLPVTGFATAPLAALPLSNVDGRPIGRANAPFGFRTTWFTGPIRAALDPSQNVLYAN